MSELTPERLAELRRIAEAATPGPWISPWHLECENAEEYGFYAANGEKVVGLFWFDGYHLECSEENARHIATFDPTTVLAMLYEIERLRRAVEQVEWVEPPDAHPDLGRWCPMCRSWEAYGHELRCPYYGGLVNGILADAPDKPGNPLAAYTDGQLYDELRRRGWVAATWAREETLLSGEKGGGDDE